jgi:hypothetical protein
MLRDAWRINKGVGDSCPPEFRAEIEARIALYTERAARGEDLFRDVPRRPNSLQAS